MPRGSPQTERLIETIELIGSRRHIGATATAISAHLGVDRATVYPMLRELCHYGWLVRDVSTKRFFLGPALIGVGTTALGALDVVDLARPQMLAVADATGLACALACAGANDLIVAEITHPQSGRRPTLGLQIADTVPFRAPLGALFVAWADDAVQTHWVRHGVGVDGDTCTRALRLRASLRIIRRRGYAIEAIGRPRNMQQEVDSVRGAALGRRTAQAAIMRLAEEVSGDLLADDLDAVGTLQVLTVGAPIMGANGHTAAALYLYDPPAGVDGRQARRLGTAVAQAATRVTTALADAAAARGTPCTK